MGWGGEVGAEGFHHGGAFFGVGVVNFAEVVNVELHGGDGSGESVGQGPPYGN